MPDPSPLPDNVIPLFRARPVSPEAFCIRSPDIFYLSVLVQDPGDNMHGQGYAVFSTGEKVQFTIDGDHDATARERCIRAGENIARQLGAELEYGRLSSQGKFIPGSPGNS